MQAAPGTDLTRLLRSVRDRFVSVDSAAKRSMRGLIVLPPAMSKNLSSGTGFVTAVSNEGAIAEGTDLSTVPVSFFPKLNLGILNIFLDSSGAFEEAEEFKWNLAKSFSSVNVCGFSAGDSVESYLSVSGSNQAGKGCHGIKVDISLAH